LDKKIEDLKVNAYKAFFRKKELANAKRMIRVAEIDRATTAHKKKQFDHTTCSGVANFMRRCWILQQTTKNIDGKNYDFRDINIQNILEEYSSAAIDASEFRKIARSSPWRQMWNGSKKRGDVFGKPSVYLDQNQLALISYSQMYDGVFENPESPKEEVIEDDDCLDGWFIEQRRKHEKDKIKQQTDDLISNPKIKNSQEIFVVANSQEEAQDIYSLNNDHMRAIIQERQQEIRASSENIHHKDLSDVKQERMMNAVNSARSAIKSKGR
jgi:arsenate reductase-like glutaredoxin family protein